MTSAWVRPWVARAGTALVPGHGRNRRVSLAWPRLPAAVEVAIIAAGYAGYALVRVTVKARRTAAIAHAAGLWRAERLMHLDIEPSLNHLAAAHAALAEVAGYYCGLAHFIVTPLVLAWLWLRRPAAFGRLRSALVLATTGADVVFWAWPVAPPRFAVPGMTDILVRYRILGADDARGPDSLVNLYAAMPSLHVAWAAWCAAAVVTATRTRWRHLAWLYPAATTFVVLASANHFVLDAAAGLAVTALGLLATRATTRPDATGPVPALARRARRPQPPAAGPPAGEPRAAAGHPVPSATGSGPILASSVSCTPSRLAGSSPNRAVRGCRGALFRAAADARAARPRSVPGRPARPGITPASAHPRACSASRTPQAAAGDGASARSPPGPGVTGPAARHGRGPAPLPGSPRVSRRDDHRPLTERRNEERNVS